MRAIAWQTDGLLRTVKVVVYILIVNYIIIATCKG